MELKRVNLDNLEQEHICCAISEKKGETSVSSKKQWLRQRMKEGSVFLKLDERGKVFIEYLPAEAAWAPVEAPGYLYIDCFWVSGKYKGKGYGDALLEECIADGKAQGKKGLVVLSTKKKMPFLSDPGYLKYKGFIVADTCEPYYELLYLPFEEGAQVPKFCHSVKKAAVPKDGWTLYYTNQCPHTAKYVPVLVDAAAERGIKIQPVHIESREAAQNAPNPFTTYALYRDGEFLTNEILSEKSFDKLLTRMNETGK